MPRLSGISLIQTMTYAPKVIFTTAHRDFGAEAFELNAVDYLLKPISLERFLKAINKVISITPVQSLENTVTQEPGFIYLRAERKMIKVYFEKILYIESLKDYVKIFRLNEDCLIVKNSIKTLEAMLPQHLFLQIHRSFLIAKQHVSAYTNNYVELYSKEVPIGRQYIPNVLPILNGAEANSNSSFN